MCRFVHQAFDTWGVRNTCQSWLGWNFPMDTTRLPSLSISWVSQDITCYRRYDHHCRILGWVVRTLSGQEWISDPNAFGPQQKVVLRGRMLRQGWLWTLQQGTWSRLRQREISHENSNTGCCLEDHVTLSRCWFGESQQLWAVRAWGYSGRVVQSPALGQALTRAFRAMVLSVVRKATWNSPMS